MRHVLAEELAEELDRRCQPLRPTQSGSDAGRYVNVDNSDSAFTTFTDSYTDPYEFMDAGKLIVVTGDKGCGKTSLIDRCAHHLTSSLNEADYLLVDQLVDDVDAGWQRRLRRTLRWIVRDASDLFLPTAVSTVRNATAAEEPSEDDIEEAFDELSKAAVSGTGTGKFMVIILLPHGSTATEVEKLARFVRPRLVIFVEADPDWKDDSAATARNLKRKGASGLNLKLGTAKDGDPARLATQIMADEPSLPTIPATITTQLYRPVITKTSVRELQRCIHAIRLIAHDENETEVNQSHVTRFHEFIPYMRSLS